MEQLIFFQIKKQQLQARLKVKNPRGWTDIHLKRQSVKKLCGQNGKQFATIGMAALSLWHFCQTRGDKKAIATISIKSEP